jgi:hypothetical protein
VRLDSKVARLGLQHNLQLQLQLLKTASEWQRQLQSHHLHGLPDGVEKTVEQEFKYGAVKVAQHDQGETEQTRLEAKVGHRHRRWKKSALETGHVAFFANRMQRSHGSFWHVIKQQWQLNRRKQLCSLPPRLRLGLWLRLGGGSRRAWST